VSGESEPEESKRLLKQLPQINFFRRAHAIIGKALLHDAGNTLEFGRADGKKPGARWSPTRRVDVAIAEDLANSRDPFLARAAEIAGVKTHA
jgi:hypothetical protein